MGVGKGSGLLYERWEKILLSDIGVSVTSTGGKLKVLQRHYQHLGKISVDSDLEATWREGKVSSYGKG